MKRKQVIVIGLVALLSLLCVKTAVANVSLASAGVAYTAFESVSYLGPLVQISYDVNATLECTVTYSCTTDGSLPPSSTCHLNVTPTSAQLTLRYNIVRHLLPNLNGTKQLTLSISQLSGIIGASSPINVPIGTDGNVTITIQGTLLGQNLTATPQGSANPNSVQWSAWTPQDTLLSSVNSQATLDMDTVYQVSFIVVVYMVGFDSVRTDSSVGQFAGNTSPSFLIPELPSTLITPVFMAITLLTAAFYARRRNRAQTNND
jgi:hypothetical protein